MSRTQPTLPLILNYTITAANTWELAFNLTSYDKIKTWKIKARETTDNAFDYAYEDNPSAYISNSGAGTTENTPVKKIYIRSASVSTVIEFEGYR